MQNDMIWFDRKFSFDLPLEMYPMILERLKGTPARIEEKVSTLSFELLSNRYADKWSVQEHVGHLFDLESLWIGRVEDFLSKAEYLRPADFKNKKTHEANHNRTQLVELLSKFRAERGNLIKGLEKFTGKGAGITSLHPRLDQPMRVIDMAYFIAEHDDHHLSKMTDLIRVGFIS